jgi:DNA-binding NtrC family response regulator
MIIGESQCFIDVLNLAKQVANSSASVLIRGESGSGKEVIAQMIHDYSIRKKFPFIPINCSAIPENLLESELFGHIRGAFTGAIEKKVGLFEEAEGGTLFLDEIGDMSIALQAKLLRVLQERKIKRIGENQFRAINIRIIAATHKDLDLAIAEKKFREDLFYRLNVIPISIPSLRERHEDIMPLAESFLKKFASENKSQARSFSKDAIKYIIDNQWRGNVRELENTIERAVVLCTDSEITLENFMPHSSGLNTVSKINNSEANQDLFSVEYSGKLVSLDEVTQRYIEFAVKKNGGARDKTAKEIGIEKL